MTQVGLQLGEKFRIIAIALVRLAQLGDRTHERFRDEHAAVGPEVSGLVGQASDDPAFSRFVQQT